MEIIIGAIVAFIALVIIRGGWSNFSRRYYNPNYKKPVNRHTPRVARDDDYWETQLSGAADQGDERRARHCASQLSDRALRNVFQMFAELYTGMQQFGKGNLTDREVRGLPVLYRATSSVMRERGFII